MFSQPCPRSGQLIPVKIDRVRDPKTCLRTNRAAFTHLCEFVRFDPAILEKSCENLPACWTVVKWSLFTGSIYPVKIHAGAKLKLNPLPVTRKLAADRSEKRRIDVRFGQGCFCCGQKSRFIASRVSGVPALSASRLDRGSTCPPQLTFLSHPDRGHGQSGS